MISSDDVRSLLAADPDAVLVVIGGQVRVLGPAELDGDDVKGALQVISRSQLVTDTGERWSDRQIEERAAALDTAVSELGG